LCRIFTQALARSGTPEEVLTDNGKVFTGRLGPTRPRCCSTAAAANKGSPTGLPESAARPPPADRSFHKTLRAELLTDRRGHPGPSRPARPTPRRPNRHRPAPPQPAPGLLRRPAHPLDPESSRLTKSWANGHHGRHARGRPETQVVSDQPVSLQDGCPRGAVEQTPIVGPDPCRGPARVARGLSIRPARGGGAVSECRGQPWRLLLVPGRGRHAPEELPRPAKNLTRRLGVDSPVDTGG
jgi:hypothetical protein